MDNKQWYDGIVLRFEKARHLVQIRTLDDQYGERRWLNMRKVAFYVVEFPDCLVNEVKEPEYTDVIETFAEEVSVAVLLAHPASYIYSRHSC